MAEFADRHSSEREAMGLTEASKPLDGLDNIAGRCGHREAAETRAALSIRLAAYASTPTPCFAA